MTGIKHVKHKNFFYMYESAGLLKTFIRLNTDSLVSGLSRAIDPLG